MADTVPAQFSYTVEDELGVSATFLANALADPAATVTQLDTMWQTIGGLLDAITGGIIRGGHYRVMQDLTGGKSSAAAGSRVEQAGVFNFSVAGTSYKTGLMVPSLKNSAITADRIDLSNSDIAAFLAAIVAATAGVLEWTSENRQALIALVDAFLSFRTHRKQLVRVSFERP
jgi:hypothetical protein